MPVEKMRHLGEHECADLVLGLTAGAARGRALAHARGCPACEERLRLHAVANGRAESAGAARFDAARPRVPAVRPWGWLAAAAALLVALALPRLWNGERPQKQRWLPSPEAGILLREGETDSHLDAGLSAYARRDFAKARTELEQAEVSGGAETTRELYLASALLALDEPEPALTLLQGLDLLDVPEPWQEEALWSLQLAYRRTGQEVRADSLRRALEERYPVAR
jgi:hypothetical protein